MPLAGHSHVYPKIGYDILQLRRVFDVEVGDYVVKLRHIPCGVRQSRLSISLREPQGGLFGPGRQNANSDAVERKRMNRAVAPAVSKGPRVVA